MLTTTLRQPTRMVLAVALMFFVLQPVQAFDYHQCLQDTRTHSPGIQSGHINSACSAKATNSGQDGAVNRANVGMISAYRSAAILSDADIANFMDRYRRSASYKRHLTAALKDQFNAGNFRVSVFSTAAPQCNTGYKAMRSTQGVGTSHQYYRRTSPYQHSFETVRYFNVKSVLCAK